MLSPDESKKLMQALQEAERALLQNAQSSLQLSMDQANETGRDSIDQSVSENLLSTDLRLRDREKKLLSKIRSAMQRVREQSIDECEDCGEPIGFKRLLARPVTTLCIHCKESQEEKERQAPKELLGTLEPQNEAADLVGED